VALLLVYLQEAHSTGGWQLPVKVLHGDPRNDAGRRGVADACVRSLKIDLSTVVDAADNRIERANTGGRTPVRFEPRRRRRWARRGSAS